MGDRLDSAMEPADPEVEFAQYSAHYQGADVSAESRIQQLLDRCASAERANLHLQKLVNSLRAARPASPAHSPRSARTSPSPQHIKEEVQARLVAAEESVKSAQTALSNAIDAKKAAEQRAHETEEALRACREHQASSEERAKE